MIHINLTQTLMYALRAPQTTPAGMKMRMRMKMRIKTSINLHLVFLAFSIVNLSTRLPQCSATNIVESTVITIPPPPFAPEEMERVSPALQAAKQCIQYSAQQRDPSLWSIAPQLALMKNRTATCDDGHVDTVVNVLAFQRCDAPCNASAEVLSTIQLGCANGTFDAVLDMTCAALRCESDQDCRDDRWCQPSAFTHNVCTAYAKEGANCEPQRCLPGLICGPPKSTSKANGVCVDPKNILEPPKQPCETDDDCSDTTWCRAVDQTDRFKTCVPYVAEGARCDGFFPFYLRERCPPSLVCKFEPLPDTDPALAPDHSGVCRAVLDEDMVLQAVESCLSNATQVGFEEETIREACDDDKHAKSVDVIDLAHDKHLATVLFDCDGNIVSQQCHGGSEADPVTQIDQSDDAAGLSDDAVIGLTVAAGIVGMAIVAMLLHCRTGKVPSAASETGAQTKVLPPNNATSTDGGNSTKLPARDIMDTDSEDIEAAANESD